MPSASLAIGLRPNTWSEVVAQSLPVTVLQNLIKASTPTPGALFHGLTGSGKTTCAHLYARALNCQNRLPQDPNPCNACESCTTAMHNPAGGNPDIRYVDGSADRSIEFIRTQVHQFLLLQPRYKYRIMIIDEVQTYATISQTALLTKLENMPDRSMLIFCTTDKSKIELPLVNRCLSLRFNGVSATDMAVQAGKTLNVPVDAALILAHASDGSFRTFWSFLEVWSHLQKPLTSEVAYEIIGVANRENRQQLWNAIKAGRGKEASELWSRWVQQGYDVRMLRETLLKDIIHMAGDNIRNGDWRRALALLGHLKNATATEIQASLVQMCGLRL